MRLRPPAAAPNPVVVENRKRGTPDWQGGPGETDGAIEGWAEPSVLPGGTIRFHVSTSTPASYEIRVYRLGWYGGAGARLVATLAGSGAAQPRVAGPTGTGWPVTDTLPVGSDWVSGYYLCRFVLTSGPQAGREARTIVVVLAPPSRRSRILVQVPVNTWQAYNPWGGKSLYDFNSVGGRANRVSFDRPYSPRAQNAFEWEIHLVRFLEREGYDVAYQTDVDTDLHPDSLLQHRLVVVAGHDEYWSSRMRDAFEAARAAGTNLAFLGANIGFWQIRYEASDHTIVAYKSKDDPLTSRSEQTIQFRDLTPPRPECQLLGVQEDAGITSVGDAPRAYTVAAPQDPWFRGTGFTSSTVLPDLVGYEWDTITPGCTPPDAVDLFHYEGGPSDADAVRYTAPSGARVFSAGSLQFTWGLDDFPSSFSGGSHPIVPGLEQFMRNALADLGRPAPPTAIVVRRASGGISIRVSRHADPRVRAVVVRRNGVVVCRTRTGACVDPGGSRRARAVYTATVADRWSESQPVAARPIVVPKRSPAS